MTAGPTAGDRSQEVRDHHRYRAKRVPAVSDPFDELYETGVLEELPPETERDAARAPPAEPFALRGCVITPDRKFEDGYVVVSGAKIASVGSAKPDGVRIVETEGVILPGLIDLHGHPEYNVFAAWEPPRLFPNRYAWRGSDEYRLVVKEPWKRLTENPSLLRDLTRYAEGRALVGGVTAIQGASAKYPGKEEALVRNVDLRIFGQHKARSVVDLSRSTDDDRSRLRAKIDAGDVNAVYVHLAEGLPSNERSRREFDELVEANLLTRGDRNHPRHRSQLAAASGREGRWSKARLVAAEQPPPLRRDDARRPRRSSSACRWDSEPTGCRAEARASSPSRRLRGGRSNARARG